MLLDGREVPLREEGGGRYGGSLGGLEPGDYSYRAEARMGDVLIGADEGGFLVERHSIESVDLRADKVLLDEIARRSGGEYRSLGQWRDLPALLPLQKRLVEKAHTLPLWGPTCPLVLVLLGIEWGLRKRRGMI